MQGRRGGGNGRGLAGFYALLLGVASIFFAVLAGLGDREDAWLITRGLLFSALTGVAAAACALRAVRRPVLGWALALGLLPAAVVSVWLGVS